MHKQLIETLFSSVRHTAKQTVRHRSLQTSCVLVHAVSPKPSAATSPLSQPIPAARTLAKASLKPRLLQLSIASFFSTSDMSCDASGCKPNALSGGTGGKYPVMGDESMMSKKAHGTSDKAAQKDLMYGCDYDTADRICNFNRHYAEHSGYAFTGSKTWVDAVKASAGKEITFYDSVTQKPLFIAPRGRSADQLIQESKSHGWPSFRDEEVVWENVRCLKDGEAISTTGTHLGHNIPDRHGNRYCINLVCIAGKPLQE